MVKKRSYIIMLVILAVFLIVMLFIFGRKSIREEKKKAVIIVGDSTVFEYSDLKWHNITYKTTLQNLSWKKYHVYSNNKSIGSYYLWHDDRWYAFDDKKNAVDIEGDLFAYSSNYNFKVVDFNTSDVDDLEFVNYVLESNDIGLSSNFTSLYKIDLDFDNDSNVETFYLISNAFASDFNPEKTFSIAFMVKNKTIYYIYKDIMNNKGLSGCKPYYNSFIDIDEDNVLEFVLSCSKFSVSDQLDMLYHFNGDNFEIIISNK